MARPIDADALQASMMDMVASGLYGLEDMIDAVIEAPTLSPDDVRGVGKWEDAKQHGLCRCSVCKDCYIEKDYITQTKWNYCPSCGSKMRCKNGE